MHAMQLGTALLHRDFVQQVRKPRRLDGCAIGSWPTGKVTGEMIEKICVRRTACRVADSPTRLELLQDLVQLWKRPWRTT